jgi:hypothetical protein
MLQIQNKDARRHWPEIGGEVPTNQLGQLPSFALSSSLVSRAYRCRYALPLLKYASWSRRTNFRYLSKTEAGVGNLQLLFRFQNKLKSPPALFSNQDSAVVARRARKRRMFKRLGSWDRRRADCRSTRR